MLAKYIYFSSLFLASESFLLYSYNKTSQWLRVRTGNKEAIQEKRRVRRGKGRNAETGNWKDKERSGFDK